MPFYAFWLPCDDESHARAQCAEHALTLHHIRAVPELNTTGRRHTGFGARVYRRANLTHFRAIRECTHAEAVALMEKFGYAGTPPEEVETVEAMNARRPSASSVPSAPHG